MAWHKASAEAGLAGLEPWEAARGVMLVAEFQNIPDPLDPPKGSFLLVSVYSNIILHSTVYSVEGVEASNNLFNLLKEHDPDHNTSWFELGERAGIEIVDEEEVDAEVQEIEEDKEVERIYNDDKDKHRPMLTGTCIFSGLSKVSKVLCTEYYVFNYR